jgi:hypothetical protein
MEQKYIILIPGGFKPPHKGHHKMINDYINNPMVSDVIVFLGSSPRTSDDQTLKITADKSEKIFDLFGTFSSPKVKLLRAATRVTSSGNKYENPFLDAVDYVLESDPNKYVKNTFAIGHPVKEPEYGLRFLQAINSAKVNTSLPPFVADSDHISATRLRNAIVQGDKKIIKESLPNPNMYKQFVNIVLS